MTYEKIIYEDAEKGKQLRIVLSEFRNIEYLHVRVYYVNMDGEWLPTKEGVAIPANISNMYAILDAMIDIVANKEGEDALENHMNKKLSNGE